MDNNSPALQPQAVPWSLSTWWEESPSSSNTLISRAPLPDTRCEQCEAAMNSKPRHLYPKAVLRVARASPDTCWQCRILLALAERRLGRLLGNDEVLEARCAWDNRHKIMILYLGTGGGEDDRLVSISSLDALPCPWNTFDARQHTSSVAPALASHSYKVASSWLKTCVTDHPGCPGMEETLLPRRVIHIGANHTDIRLVEHNSPTLGRYSCLSHCWGGAQPLITTTHNIAQHLERIEWNSISKTFQDAIKFTAHLGIAYIWIDSLCIIQDSPQDWVEESAKMCSIYENGHLTIAASAASNGSGGLPVRDSSGFVRLSGTTSSPESKPFDIIGYFELGGIEVRDHPSPTNRRTPLFSRGWVHQEMLLSPRVVHFAKKELLWECKTVGTCQCPQPPTFRKIFFKEGHYEALNSSRQSSARLAGDLLAHQWHKIIESYSRLHLSFPGDKFPALSGLAQQMSKRRGHDVRYLAGLWSDSLLTDLLWTATYRYVWGLHSIDRILRGKHEWRAPSWSWAARDVPVIFPRMGAERNGSTCEANALCNIIGAETTLATTDKTGRISGGRLVVRGRLFDASLYRDIEPSVSRGGSAETKATITLSVQVPVNLTGGVKTFISFAFDRGTCVYFMTQADAQGLKNSKPDELGILVKEGFNPDPMAELFSMKRTDSREYMGSDIKVMRIGRVGRRMPAPDDKKWLEDMEYALVLQGIDTEPTDPDGAEAARTYRRIGIIHQGREGYKGVEDEREDFWKRYPSCFEEGGREETITLV
ncbi:heterokaryon incompatibility protein-domain-containing protein [Neurospora hispaniola]|uniref:Heterokaryon incompatibility protein-domain-containing protein n=1 Tax=Neurospora hispaniola TaxID=588809 RepID=A0AAJ0MLQ6_9PEZI|nr:heterokaryon incompatibility protein-domain-containing protein [Neurospora hispaniola]